VPSSKSYVYLGVFFIISPTKNNLARCRLTRGETLLYLLYLYFFFFLIFMSCSCPKMAVINFLWPAKLVENVVIAGWLKCDFECGKVNAENRQFINWRLSEGLEDCCMSCQAFINDTWKCMEIREQNKENVCNLKVRLILEKVA